MGQSTTPTKEGSTKPQLPEKKKEKRRNSESEDDLKTAVSSKSLTTEKTQASPAHTSKSSSSIEADEDKTEKQLPRTLSLVSVTSFLKTTLLPGQKSPTDKLMIRPAICKLPLKDVSKFCISLSGCGFLGSYHFGAVRCLVQHGEPVISRLDRVSGASAGSLVASLLVLAPEKIPLGLDVLYEMADELNSLKFGALTPGYLLNERLIRIVDAHLPVNISPAQKKLYVSLTNHKTRQNHLVSNFPSREYLIQCLLASCYIPMYSMGYSAHPPVIDGVPYIDGGYSNNLPDFEDVRTITISPFSGSAEISPSDATVLFDWQMEICNQFMKVNMQNIVRGAQALFPPNRDVLRSYYEHGYKDTFKFLLDNGLLKRQEGTAV